MDRQTITCIQTQYIHTHTHTHTHKYTHEDTHMLAFTYPPSHTHNLKMI